MARVLVLIGVTVLIAGIFVAFKWAPGITRGVGDFTRIGSGFDGALPLTPDEINRSIEQANQAATSVNQAAIVARSWAQWLLMIVVVLGAGTTILAGLQKAATWSTGAGSVLTVMMGLLGAGAAISTSGSTYLSGVADAKFACVAEIEKEAGKTLTAVRGETDPQAARQYLNDLVRLADRCKA